ncbi:MAG: GNAT family N-acetyltransferase [candidate division Zixibacteria bacterium]|nr:GNAT family N-acetyltransferase [candidate division Zixibacteria bacterium]
MERQPSLITERLVLRSFELGDAPLVTILAGEREIACNTLHIPHPYEVGMAEDWICTHQDAYTRGVQVIFAIVRQNDNRLMGAIGLDIERGHNRAEMGYWIGKPYWSKGYCTEAARAVLKYGFEKLELNRIQASYFSRNIASGRVMEKIGMSYEGCLRSHIYKWGEYLDQVTRAILKSEYEAGINK